MTPVTLLQPVKENAFQLFKLPIPKVGIQNRRYLGNKFKLLTFIEEILANKCPNFESLCDIFAGTGVVGSYFNKAHTRIISNDILTSNYVCLSAFLKTSVFDEQVIEKKIAYLNSLDCTDENYFSQNFGGTYFTHENARKIGNIRQTIDLIAETESEKHILLCALIYAVDKTANTVGHYDAYRKVLDTVQPLKLHVPAINYSHNGNNEVYKEDANTLVKNISCDVMYIDPPYNSRQYSDAYHLLENLAEWKRPDVKGIAKKMDRSHIKSAYCLKSAKQAFEDLIVNANCHHILLSYNNTGESKDGRSNARISDNEIVQILNRKGVVKIFEKDYRAFTAGKSDCVGHTERIFYCKVTN